MLTRVHSGIRSMGAAFGALLLLAASSRMTAATPVEQYGLLKIQGGKLCSAAGTPVQIKGMSWFWSQWSSAWWNAAALSNAVDQYGISVARLAMQTPSNGADIATEKARVITMVEAARAKGIYVIIDWHSHVAQDYTEQSRAFFVEMATAYKNVPNVMFEIYNEPLNTTSWATVRAYAETVGGAIRATGANNVIIVGTRTWSQDVDEASAHPVSFSNAAYTLHFYADTHRLDSGFRQKVDTALSRGCAIFVTEWGTDNNLAQGPVNEVETRAWMAYLEANQISWANWSFFDKEADGETASFFKAGTSPTGPWTEANLSPSGLLVKQFLTAPDPKLAASPNAFNVPYGASTQTSALTAKVGWTAASSHPWIGVTPASGATNANLSLSIQANAGTAPRSGQVTLTGSDGSSTRILVNQAAAQNAPTITAIADQTIPSGGASAPIPFTIGDVETPAANLRLVANTDNPGLLPLSRIRFGGSGASRTVTISPAAGLTGTAKVRIWVTDTQGGTNSALFMVTVKAPNQNPTITTIPDQTIGSGGSSVAIPFTIGDAETAAASLILVATTDSPTLLPLSRIVFAGSGAQRTVTITAASGLSGVAKVRVRVTDPQGGTSSTLFTVTVLAGNQNPTITAIADQTISASGSSAAIPFAIGDAETPVASLVLVATTDSPTLLPLSRIVFAGSGAQRTVTITPAAGLTGTAKVRVRVTDAMGGTSSTLFTVTVSPDGQTRNFLRANGSRLLDARGQEVRLTGVNWFGFETSALTPHGLWSRDCRSMLVQIKDLGFNCVRFPFTNRMLRPDARIQISAYGVDSYSGATPMNARESAFTTPIQLLDQIIQYCQDLNLKVILDSHARIPDGYMSEEIWYDATCSEAQWITDWEFLAVRYAEYDCFVACDLDNEPHGRATWGHASPSTDWNKAAERCGNAILAKNPKLLIFVEGVEKFEASSYWWGGNLKGVASDPVVLSVPGQLVYSPHEYGPAVFPQTWFEDPSFPANLPGIWDDRFGFIARQGTAPLFVGEFGIREPGGKDEVWIKEFLKYMGTGYSWTFWCWNPNSGDTGGLLDDQWKNLVTWKYDLLKPYLAPEIPNQ